MRRFLILSAAAVLVLVGGQVQSKDMPPPRRVEYTGKYTYTTEVEQGGETCVRWQPEWNTVGAFYVESQTTTTTHIREEALGCALTLSTEGQRSSAQDTECEWVGPVNATALGMTKRTYSDYQVDFEQGTIAAEGQFERTLKSGARMVTCFRLSGEFPVE
jgi:hypothetical protein